MSYANDYNDIRLGDIVEVEMNDFDFYDLRRMGFKGTARLFVVSKGQDCDGTPLYSLGLNNIAPPKSDERYDKLVYLYLVIHLFHNFPAESLKVVGYSKIQSFEECFEEFVRSLPRDN